MSTARATPQALAAVRAVKCQRQWGPYMTLLFVIKRQAAAHANAAIAFESRRTK